MDEMKITFKYSIDQPGQERSFDLPPEIYFDPLDNHETYENDGISRYLDDRKHICDFDESVRIEDISSMIFVIEGSPKHDTIIKTTYYGNGQSEVSYRKDKCGFEEIIQSFRVTSNTILITKMNRSTYNSNWKISSSCGLNYMQEHLGKEEWISVTAGEYIDVVIPND